MRRSEILKEMKLQIINVFEWGLSRKLYNYSSIPVQLVKLAEEYHEYIRSVTLNDRDAARDALGDMLVVAINLYGVSLFKNVDFKSSLFSQSFTDPHAVTMQASYVFDELVNDIEKGYLPEFKNIEGYNRLFMVVEELIKLAIRDSITPSALLFILITEINKISNLCTAKEGLKLAYEEIKNRRGYFTSSGTFVKEEDLYDTSSFRVNN